MLHRLSLRQKHLFLPLISLCAFSELSASVGQTYIVNQTGSDPNTSGTLPWAITQANSPQNQGSIISVTGSITVNGNIPPITQSVTITGSNSAVITNTSPTQGTAQTSIFFVESGSCSISNLTLTGNVVGGTGGSGNPGTSGQTTPYYPSAGGGGGGGAGMGGAIFVNNGATVTVANVAFTNCTATGGTGGEGGYYVYNYYSYGGGGGGGGGGILSTGGAGGTYSSSYHTSNQDAGGGGGGGGGSFSASSAQAGNPNTAPSTGGSGGSGAGGAAGGAGGNPGSGAVGSTPSTLGDGGGGAGGGGSNAPNTSGAGGTGGSGAAFGGGGGGGGGGGWTFTPDGPGGYGGAGGFGGGGGGAGSSGTGGYYGGAGGFGGGSGGGGGDGAGTAGYGGGKGGAGGTTKYSLPQDGCGGGGGGLGGAIFVMDGGSLNIGSGVTFNGCSVTGGQPGVVTNPPSNATATQATAGSAYGNFLFLNSGANVTLGSGLTFNSNDFWGDPLNTTSPGNLTVTSSVTLANQVNTFVANILIDSGGTLTVSADGDLGALANTVTLNVGELAVGSSFATARQYTVEGNSTINLTDSMTFNSPSSITLQNSPTLTVSGGNTLTLNNTSISGSGAINLQGPSATFNYTQSGSLSCAIQGLGPVTFQSGNTYAITLFGANTYTGQTTIPSGSTLALSGTGSIAASSLLSISGTFDTSGATTGVNVTSITGGGGIVLGSNNLAIANGDSNTFSGGISGGGALTLSSEVLTLSGSNTYTGATTIGSGATLALSGSGSIASSSLLSISGTFDTSGATTGVNVTSITGGGGIVLGSNNLTITNGGSNTFSGSISNISGGSGGLILSGGTLTLSGSSSYSGGTTINSAAILAGSNSSLGTGNITAAGISPSLTLSNNVHLSNNISLGASLSISTASGASGQLSGIISGGSNLILSGGTLTLSGSSSYSGGTTVGALANLVAGASSALGSGRVKVSGTATLTLEDGVSLANAVNLPAGSPSLVVGSGSASLNGIISGAGSLNFSGGGILSLGGRNTYSGATHISAGTLNVSGSIAKSSEVNIASGATFGVQATQAIKSLQGSGSVVLNGGTTLSITRGGSYSGIISETPSSGNLSLIGGNITLSGANTYSGTTTLQSVTATAGNDAAFGTGPIAFGATTSTLEIGSHSLSNNINLDGTSYVSVASGTGTLSGVISGASTLRKIGNGSLTLTNASTYSGPTSIEGGTLILSSTSSPVIQSSVINVAQGSTLTFGTSNAVIPLASIVMNGTLQMNNTSQTLSSLVVNGQVQGSGSSLTLSDLTMYGGSSVSSGVAITYAGDGRISSIATTSSEATIAANLSLEANNISFNIPKGNASADVAISGSISGSGSITKKGSGILELSASNSYTGSTNIETGTVSLAIGNALSPSSSVAMTDGTLAIGGYNQSVNAISMTKGNITGSGTLSVANLLTMSSSCSIAPPLHLQGASATIHGGAATPATISSVDLGNPYTFDVTKGSTTNDFVITGAITGASITKTGAGTMAVIGSSPSYSGTVAIQHGALRLNGSMPQSDVTVEADGKMMGTGTCHSLVNNGVIAPGNSIGTVHVAGSYTQTGELDIEINAKGQTDLVDITGAATLGGVLHVVTPSTVLAGSSYTILEAQGGVSGTFSSNNIASLPGKFYLDYNPNTVVISATQNSFFNFSTINKHNPLMVKNNLEASVTAQDTDFVNIIVQLDTLDPSQQTSALNKFHPSHLSALSLMRQAETATLTGLLIDSSEQSLCVHSDKLCRCRDNNLWAIPYEQLMTVDPTNSQQGFYSNTKGIIAGFDHAFHDVTVGIAGGYSYNHFSWMHSYGNGHYQSAFGGMYVDWMRKNAYAKLSAIGAVDRFHHTRHIFFTGFDAKAKGSHSGAECALRLEGGYDFKVGKAFIQPFGNEGYFFLQEGSFTEHGAGVLNLHVDGKNTQYLRSEVGARLSRAFTFHSGCWSPTLSLSYVNLYQLTSREYQTRFTTLPESFEVWRYSRSWNLIAPAFDLTFNMNKGWSLRAKYRGEYNSVYQMNEWDLRLVKSF